MPERVGELVGSSCREERLREGFEALRTQPVGVAILAERGEADVVRDILAPRSSNTFSRADIGGSSSGLRRENGWLPRACSRNRWSTVTRGLTIG